MPTLSLLPLGFLLLSGGFLLLLGFLHQPWGVALGAGGGLEVVAVPITL